MCLLASFGSSVTGPTEYAGGSVLEYFSPEQRVSLTVSNVADTPGICLFYNREEFDDVLLRYSVLHKMSCDFTPNAHDYLYSITSGHSAAVSSLERYFLEIRVELENDNILLTTKQYMVNSLFDEQTVFKGPPLLAVVHSGQHI